MAQQISKMQWFIDQYNNNVLVYNIYNTHRNFGAITMPTGTGKSAEVFKDIIKAIETKKDGQKIIFNISCPILKLTQQFINDLFAVLSPIYGTSKKITAIINSSDNGKQYNNKNAISMNIDFKPLSRGFNQFLSSDTDIAIIASCHKSLYKFINLLKKTEQSVLRNIQIINYLDEAHLIDVRKNNEDENVVYIDLPSLCKYSNKVYALSATHDPEVIRTINAAELGGQANDSSSIYLMSPREAINKNYILPPLVRYIQTATKGLDINLLIKIMKDVIKDNPNINHKVLVTLKSTDELKNVRIALEKAGYKVFSTCSRLNYGTKEKGEINLEEKPDNYDVTKFIQDVEDYDGDCFVLHIRQLIQGIDIKALTDCVIWSADTGNQRHYRHIIQIIGRTLRTLDGERGMDISKRKKKYGMVYFISPDDALNVRDNISNFICRYYGINNITFEYKTYETGIISNERDRLDNHDNTKAITTGYDNPIIKDILINIRNFIKNTILAYYKVDIRFFKNTDIKELAKDILNEFDTQFTDLAELNTVELLSNEELIDKVIDLLHEYGIYEQNKLW